MRVLFYGLLHMYIKLESIMKHIRRASLFLILPMICAASGIFNGEVGPTWTFDYLRLNREAQSNKNFLSTANEQTAWNLGSALKLRGGISTKKIGSLVFSGTGEWIRNGLATITDSSIDASTNAVLVENITRFYANTYVIKPYYAYEFSLNDMFSVDVGFGYSFTRTYKRLNFIELPLIFFSYSRYKGGCAGIEIKLRDQQIAATASYMLTYGSITSELTQNPAGPSVERCIPAVLKNNFVLTVQKKYSAAVSCFISTAYTNVHNHKTGTSKNYFNNVLQSVVKNVQSIETKNVDIAIGVTLLF